MLGSIPQYYRDLGARIWCIDPWYCFGGRSTSAGKFGQEKFFTSILMVQSAIFFCFLQFLENMVKLFRMVNICFLGAFRGLKDQFPAKYHISGHYITKYGFLKNRIFGDFLMIFLILPIWFVAGIGRKWPDRWNIIKNVFLGLFRSVFMPITLI